METCNITGWRRVGQANYPCKQHDRCAPCLSFGSRLRHVDDLLRCDRQGAKPRTLQETHKATQLATASELSDFLAEVERRAYKQALFAVRDDHLALDIVQDSMLKLADKYSTRPPHELPLLFQRILQNTIRDFYRRQKVRSMWTLPMSSLFGGGDGDEDYDPLEALEIETDSNFGESPASQLERSQLLGFIEKALENLPGRQRQTFLLRYWEEMDVAEAAK